MTSRGRVGTKEGTSRTVGTHRWDVAGLVSPASLHETPLRSPSITNDAYSRLRRDIVHARFGPGEKLRVDELRDAYGIGTTPLREALNRLSAVGLVELTSQRGFRVPLISKDDLDDITAQRVHFETEALRDSVTNGSNDWEIRVSTTFELLFKLRSQRSAHQLDEEAVGIWEARNRDFHEALVSACRSRWTLFFRALAYDQHERYRWITARRAASRRPMNPEHRQIMEAALNRDARLACELTTHHILASVANVRARLAEARR